jgi:hypothetical protein
MKTHPFLRCVGACRSLPVTRTSDYAAVRSDDSDSQTLAALGATRVQDGTARTGSHARTETVSALATDDGRLVGTFHFSLARLYTAEISKKPGLARQEKRSDAAPGQACQARSAANLELDSSFCISVNHLDPLKPDPAAWRLTKIANMASSFAGGRLIARARRPCGRSCMKSGDQADEISAQPVDNLSCRR